MLGSTYRITEQSSAYLETQQSGDIYFGWVCSLVSSGSPHVHPMGRTYGEPTEIGLTAMGVKLNGSLRVRPRLDVVHNLPDADRVDKAKVGGVFLPEVEQVGRQVFERGLRDAGREAALDPWGAWGVECGTVCGAWARTLPAAARPAACLPTVKNGNIFRVGIFLDFARLSTRTEGPRGAYVRPCGEPNEIELTPIRVELNGSRCVRLG